MLLNSYLFISTFENRNEHVTIRWTSLMPLVHKLRSAEHLHLPPPKTSSSCLCFQRARPSTLEPRGPADRYLNPQRRHERRPRPTESREIPWWRFGCSNALTMLGYTGGKANGLRFRRNSAVLRSEFHRIPSTVWRTITRLFRIKSIATKCHAIT